MRLPTIVVRGNVLNSWLTLSECTQTQFARDLGISTGRISQLLRSTEEPSAHLMAKLLQRTSLPFNRLFKVINRKPAASSLGVFTNGSANNGGAHAPRGPKSLRAL